MDAMACVPTMRTRRMEIGTPPHPSTLLVLRTRPTRAPLHNAYPKRNLHHLVAGATTTDIVPIINHTIAASPLLQQRRKRSMKVCLHYSYTRKTFWCASKSGYCGAEMKLKKLCTIFNWKPEAKGPLESNINFCTVFACRSSHITVKERQSDCNMSWTNRLTSDKKNSVAFSPQANYTDWRPPLVDEI
jgi:hypothetical protein